MSNQIEAIEQAGKAYRAAMEAGDIDAIMAAWTAGEWAFERPTMQIALKPKGGGEEVEWKGQYVIVWQAATDGTWKLARAINNSDLPEGHAGHK